MAGNSSPKNNDKNVKASASSNTKKNNSTSNDSTKSKVSGDVLEFPKKTTRNRKRSLKAIESGYSTANESNANAITKQESQEKSNKWTIIPKTGKPLEVCCCKSCGLHGVFSGFLESGQFCSEYCSKRFKEINRSCVEKSNDINSAKLKEFDVKKKKFERQLAPKKLATSMAVTTASTSTVLCVPTINTSDATKNPNINPPVSITTGVGVINLTIANGEVLKSGTPTTSDSISNSNAKFSPLLVPIPTSTLLMSTSGLKNQGQPMMLLKPVVQTSIGNTINTNSTFSLNSGPKVTHIASNAAIQTPQSNMQKTVFFPLLPAGQVMASPNKSLSTTNGQQLQITLNQCGSQLKSPTSKSITILPKTINNAIKTTNISKTSKDCNVISTNSNKISVTTSKIDSNTSVTSVTSTIISPITQTDSQTLANSCSSPSSETKNDDNDPIKMLDWTNGIGTLPGSSLKFKINELGTLEIINDETNSPIKIETVSKNSSLADPDDAIHINVEAKYFEEQSTSSIETTDNSDQKVICCCNTCGCFGLKSEFCGSGRFCSMVCVGANAHKKRVKKSMINKTESTNPIEMNKDESKCDTSEISCDKKLSPDEKDPKKLCCCENCGCNGLMEQFCKSGRFCSMSCVGSYARKQRLLRDVVVSKDSSKDESNNMEWDIVEEIAEKKENESKLIPEKEKTINSPSFLFINNFPSQQNGFKSGMKLEGIDPSHQSLFCVLTVVDVLGFRIRLHFDEYSNNYDFWVNADSKDIFPIGWCEKNSHKLSPPKGFSHPFSWPEYLKITKSQPAPKHLFSHVNKNNEPATLSEFQTGMYLEAVDKKNHNLICVVSVADVIENRFRVHFDGWDDSYDYWADATSPYIHPVGWCEANTITITPPNNYEYENEFVWNKYLKEKKAVAVPAKAFRPRQPNPFPLSTKIEAVDPRNPVLIRPATIIGKEGHSLLVTFDGWPSTYDFCVDDDSPNIYPANWCAKTKHPLQPLPANVDQSKSLCKTHGCFGIGHVKGPRLSSHHTLFGCPYAETNMTKNFVIQDRLGGFREDVIITTLPFKKTSQVVKVENHNIDNSNENFSFRPQPFDNSNHFENKPMQECKTLELDMTTENSIKEKTKFVDKILKTPKLSTAIVETASDDSSNLSTKSRAQVQVVKKKRGRKRKNFDDYVMSEFFNPEVSDNSNSYVAEEAVHKTKSTIDGLAITMTHIHNSVFCVGRSIDPDKDFEDRWQQQMDVLMFPDMFKVSDKVSDWSISQVSEFIRSLPVDNSIADKFKEEQVDGESLIMMKQADLVKVLGIKLGPAIILYNCILRLLKQEKESSE